MKNVPITDLLPPLTINPPRSITQVVRSASLTTDCRRPKHIRGTAISVRRAAAIVDTSVQWRRGECVHVCWPHHLPGCGKNFNRRCLGLAYSWSCVPRSVVWLSNLSDAGLNLPQGPHWPGLFPVRTMRALWPALTILLR